MKNKTLLIIVGVTVLAAGVFLLKTSKNSKGEPAQTSTVKSKRYSSVETSEELSKRYIDYSPESLEEAQKSGGRTVIFFAALDWCYSCQLADKDLRENFDQVPEDVTILVAEYDKEKELEKKYDVTMQTTFVQVDENGRKVTSWISGGRGVKDLLENIEET